MKKIVTIFIASIALQANGQASQVQQPSPQGKYPQAKQNKAPKSTDEKVAKRMDRLTKELNLTPTQQAQLAPIIKQKIEFQLNQALANDQKTQENQDLKQQKEAFRQQIRGILTPEQITLLENENKNHKNRPNR